MKAISVQQALALIHGREEIHCIDINPVTDRRSLMTGWRSLMTGWHKEYPSAKEAIETADELYLLDTKESFLSHRLLCVNPKGKYPEKQVFMEIREQK